MSLITVEDLKGKLDFDSMKNMSNFRCLLKMAPIIREKLLQEERKTNDILARCQEGHQEHNESGKGKRISSGIITTKRKIDQNDFMGGSELERATIPDSFRKCIEGELQGKEIKLLIEKRLYDSDLKPNEGRMSIPNTKMCKEVLTPEEVEWLKTARGKKNEVLGMELKMVDPQLKVRKIMLKHWNLKKENGKVGSMYVLSKYWNEVVKELGLQKEEVVQLWGFRMGEEVPGELGLALVRLGMTNNGASCSRA
ncbi:B3 domain-containing protein At2g31420 [Linum perenne]